jgi:hypothetical protein
MLYNTFYKYFSQKGNFFTHKGKKTEVKTLKTRKLARLLVPFGQVNSMYC